MHSGGGLVVVNIENYANRTFKGSVFSRPILVIVEGNLFSKRDDLEFANISTNFTVMDECERLYTCPKTSQYVFFVGDPEKDEVLYRKNYFTDVCR